MKRVLLCFFSLAMISAAGARPSAKIYAQELIDRMVASYPDVLVMAMHVTPPKGADNVIIASNIGRVGKKADPDDLRVIQTGAPNLAVNKAGDRFEVELLLRDASARPIGALGIVFPYTAGTDRAALQKRAEVIRDQLARRISHAANLLEPAQFDSSIPTQTYGQALVDQALNQHPAVVILALHAQPVHSSKNVIVASNIGRIGKPADEDDLHVITSGETKLELNETGDRYEVEQTLLNTSGKVIGAVGVVFPYKKGQDTAPLQAEAAAIRAELGRKISNADQLMQPQPPAASGATPAAASATLAAAGATHAAAGAALAVAGRTELPGYSGDFDHFAVDLPGNRLFLAAEDHGTLEVFDLRSGRHLKTIAGFETPHSIFYARAANRLIVTDSGKGMTKVLDAQTYAVTGSIKLTLGADSIGYDAARGRLYVVTGGKDVDMKQSFLAEIDPVTGKQFGDVRFDSNHTEAMAIEQRGSRLFINLTDKNSLAVVDKNTHTVLAQWPIKEAEQNAPVAFDEANRRLFIVTRKPGKLVIVNADTGASIASFKAPERSDEVVFDTAHRRIYVLGGEGYIGVFQQQDSDRYSELARVPSAKGAKTGIWVPQLNRLYAAVSPGEEKTGAAVMWFDAAN